MQMTRAFKASKQQFEEEQRGRFGVSSPSIRRDGRSRITRSTRSTAHLNARSSSIPYTDPDIFRKQRSTQTKIKTMITKDIKKSPYYRNMVETITDCGFGIPSPRKQDIKESLLDEEVEEQKTYIENFHKFWIEYGYTLLCDGWTTQNRRHIK
ncbi:hypothetical protein AKJ16_DCAP14056, partial [Drosera capensis]